MNRTAADIDEDLIIKQEDESSVGRAMKVARVVVAKDGDEFVKLGDLVEVRFVKGHSISLTASRLLALMILAAGADAWEEMRHRMRKADIRRGHKVTSGLVICLKSYTARFFRKMIDLGVAKKQ
jgi:hypothetical protein